MKNKYQGLSENEVLNNQKLYGKNIIIQEENNKKIKNIIQILHPTFILLVIFLFLYLILGKSIYATIISIISVIILIIHLYQYIKLNKMQKSLNNTNQNKCKVIRNEKEVIINSENITIDDILVINEGDKINADAIILESNNLYVDESNIIKDNINVSKSNDLLNKDALLKSNYIYKESFVIKGSAVAKVINIGNKTEYAKRNNIFINEENNCCLKIKIDKFYKIIYIISILLLIIMGIIFIINNNIIIGIISGITMVIAIIPITTKLTFKYIVTSNIYKICKNNSLIKKGEDIKSISQITCLCVDKIGLVTSDRMQVKEFYSTIGDNDAIINCVLASNKNSMDPIDQAIFDYADIHNVKIDNDYKLIKKYSYNKKTKLMGNVYEYNNELYLFVKGSLNSLFDICELGVEEKYKLHNFKKQLYKKGLHVMAFASSKIKTIEKDILKYNINFNGILGLNYIPKENVKESIDEFIKNGINVILMTKDNIEISSSLGKKIGIDNYKNLLTGKEIDEIDDKELVNRVKDIKIFSKISENQKLRIINALKTNNEVVAITGNTSCELDLIKSADVGITINNMGADINKEFAKLIILDDNLKTIVNTIKDTKFIINYINKLLRYIIISNILLILLFGILIILNCQVLLIPILIIVLKIILEIICYLVLNKKYCKHNV